VDARRLGIVGQALSGGEHVGLEAVAPDGGPVDLQQEDRFDLAAEEDVDLSQVDLDLEVPRRPPA